MLLKLERAIQCGTAERLPWNQLQDLSGLFFYKVGYCYEE